MPNWCFTDYVIEGDDPNEVADLFQKLQGLERAKEPLVPDSKRCWLGNVVALFGGDKEKIRHRGEINDVDMVDGHIQFSTETAWVDFPELWDLVCSRYKTLRYYYRAEECGCVYYATNDVKGKYFPERFLLYIENEDNYYFDTEDELLKFAAEKFGREFKNPEEVEAAVEQFNEKNPDNMMSFNQFEVDDTTLSSGEDTSDQIYER